MDNAVCPFCNIENDSFSLDNANVIAVPDKFPVSTLHTLILPRRHLSSIFEVDLSEWNDFFDLLKKVQQRIISEDPSVTGFNIGINGGPDAGQTLEHCHVHVIPRRKGDVPNPRGGVRNIFAGKGDYLPTISGQTKILVDEMFDGTDDKLRALGFEAYSVKKLLAKGEKLSSDFSVLNYAQSNNMILITEDGDNVDSCNENGINCVPYSQNMKFEDLVQVLKCR